ncbi:MAG: hypothetical protein ACE37I_04980 [Rubinisphaera brasiliensis]|uniref:hypothetical protein n=1 Tax=Rubinisphaera brasiliensis TaxID=119 RepID=UPI00391A9E8C
MIQFECPHCAAVLRVPDSAMGQRGTCPKCKQALLVPSLEELTAQQEQSETASTPVTSDSTVGQAPASSGPDSWLASNPPEGTAPLPSSDQAVGDLLSALHSPAAQRREDDPLISATRRSKARNQSSLLTAIVFLAIAVGLGIGAYVWLQPKMQGDLTAEQVSPDALKTKTLSPKTLGHGDAYRQFLKTHVDDRININSQLLRTSLEPTEAGLLVNVSPAGGCDLYRVNVLQNKALQQYHLDHYGELEKQRLAQIQDAAGEFFEQIAEAEDVLRGNPANLLQYRDRLILPAGVDALGFRLAAFVESTMYPCIWQDKDDRLYFAVPKGTKRFEIREREVYGQPRQFPANLKFVATADSVSEKTANEYDYNHMWGGEKGEKPASESEEGEAPAESSTEEQMTDDPDAEASEKMNPPDGEAEPMKSGGMKNMDSMNMNSMNKSSAEGLMNKMNASSGMSEMMSDE